MSIPNIEQPLIINMCPTGIISTKDHNVNIPISRSKIVDTVLQASELGIQMVHLHGAMMRAKLRVMKKNTQTFLVLTNTPKQ